MKNINKILGFLSLTIAFTLSAQDTTLYNNGATMFISPKTVMTVLGSSINGGDLLNAGDLHLKGGIRTKAGSNIANSDTIHVSGNWLQVVGQYLQGYKGTINYNSPAVDTQFIFKSDGTGHFYNVAFSGGAPKSIHGMVIVDSSINFNNGIVFVQNADTLALLDGTVYGGNTNSFVSGFFYRQGFGELFYPIGKVGGVAAVNYRPATILNVPTSPEMPVIGFRFRNIAQSGTPGDNVQTVNNNFYWKAHLRSGDYFGSKLKLRHYGTDALLAGQAVIVQSVDKDGEYFSIGGVDLTATDITSEFIAGEDYYTFGRTANMTTEVTALLQDNMLTAITMNDDLYDSGYLTQYTDGGTNALGVNMLAGYQLPTVGGNGPVDYVQLYLRSSASGANLDTAYAWLMTNGTIRDFFTGTKTYATFKNYTNLTVGSNYFVVMEHRNHLPAMHTAQVVNQDTTGAILFNLTDITNVYGAGAYYSGTNALLYSGNADVNKFYYSKYIVDADDFDKVRIPANNSMPSGYLLEDVNMDGTVNNMDWDITKTGVDNLYYSTVPF